MSKATVTLLLDHSTDAKFRVWGQQMKTFLGTTIGLTQTADTGQADWTTAVRPGTNTVTPYEIYRLNDAAQSTRPLFMKFKYGTAAVTDRAWLTIDYGEGSDGAGNLTGATWAGLDVFYENSSSTATTIDLLMNWNATTGYFGWTTMNAVAVGPRYYMMNSFERLRALTGAPTTRGFAVTYATTSPSYQYRTMVAGSFSSDTGNTIPLFWPQRSQGASSAGGTFISGLTPLTGDGTHGPLERTLGFCGVGYGEFSGGDQFTITRWDGSTHTYLCTYTYGSANQNGNTVETNCRHAIWWE